MKAGPRNGPEAPEAAATPRERLLRRFEHARLAGQDVVERVDEGAAVVLRRRSHTIITLAKERLGGIGRPSNRACELFRTLTCYSRRPRRFAQAMAPTAA